MSVNDKPKDKYEALGARLKFLREQWQQSVSDVCNTLEIDQKTLRALESGKVAPSVDILDMLISHFLLTEDQAQDLRDLAEDQRYEAEGCLAGAMEDVLSKQFVMFMPIDNRIVYTDSMQATVTDTGVVLQFMQQAGNGQPVPVSRIGMSRQHAEKVIEVLQSTLRHHDQHDQKRLSSPDNGQKS
ncbi:MAG: helix-turn-helix domain-containing protein [Candidatus Saccharimonadales bacterium]